MTNRTISTEAELSTLAAMLTDNDVYWQISGTVFEDHFTISNCRKAFRFIAETIENGDTCDAVNLMDHFGRVPDDVRQCLTIPHSPANATSYAKIVADRAKLRAGIKATSGRLSQMSEGRLEAIPDLQADLEGLSADESGGSIDFAQALRHGMETVQANMDAGTDGVVGLPLGISAIDQRIGGFQPQKLYIVAARPSLGKTALAMQASLNSAKGDSPVGICSLEMGYDELAIRSMAYEYGLNGTALTFGNQTEVTKLQAKVAERNIRDYPIYMDDGAFKPGEIVGRLTEWHRRYGIKLGVVDHLQLVDIGDNDNRNNALGEVTSRLKKLAKRLHIPIILVCQLNRSNERQSRAPRLSDLRDSGNIEQDADVVLAIHGELDSDTGRAGCRDVQFGLLKNRGGRVGWLEQEGFVFDGPCQRFREVQKVHSYMPEEVRRESA